MMFVPKPHDRILKDIEDLSRFERTSFNVQEIGVY